MCKQKVSTQNTKQILSSTRSVFGAVPLASSYRENEESFNKLNALMHPGLVSGRGNSHVIDRNTKRLVPR